MVDYSFDTAPTNVAIKTPVKDYDAIVKKHKGNKKKIREEILKNNPVENYSAIEKENKPAVENKPALRNPSESYQRVATQNYTEPSVVKVNGQGYSVAPELQQEFVRKKNQQIEAQKTESNQVTTKDFSKEKMVAPKKITSSESMTPEQQKVFIAESTENINAYALERAEESKSLEAQKRALAERDYGKLASTSASLAISGAGRAPMNAFNFFSPVTTEGKVQVPIVQPTLQFGKYLATGEYIADFVANPVGTTSEFLTTGALLKSTPAKNVAKAEIGFATDFVNKGTVNNVDLKIGNVEVLGDKAITPTERTGMFIKNPYIKGEKVTVLGSYPSVEGEVPVLYEKTVPFKTFVPSTSGQTNVYGGPKLMTETSTDAVPKMDAVPSVQYTLPEVKDTFTYAGKERGWIRSVVTEINPKIAEEKSVSSMTTEKYTSPTETQTKLPTPVDIEVIEVFDEKTGEYKLMEVYNNLPSKESPFGKVSSKETVKTSNKNVVDNSDKFKFEPAEDSKSNTRQVSSSIYANDKGMVSTENRVSDATYDTELISSKPVKINEKLEGEGLLPITMAMYNPTQPSTEQPLKINTSQARLPELKVETKIGNTLFQPTAQESSRKLIEDTTPKIRTTTRTITEPVIEQIQQPSQITTPISVQRVELRTTPEPKRPEKIIKPLLLNTQPDRQRKSGFGQFSVLTKKEGRWTLIGSGYSDLATAFNRGKQEVAGTARASFKVVSNFGESQKFNLSREKTLRPSKVDASVVVQKSQYRISSVGEKKEITQKGIFTQRTRKLLKKNKGVFG